jgi:hypothetical protein
MSATITTGSITTNPTTPTPTGLLKGARKLKEGDWMDEGFMGPMGDMDG